jgi:hypothetical protein
MVRAAGQIGSHADHRCQRGIPVRRRAAASAADTSGAIVSETQKSSVKGSIWVCDDIQDCPAPCCHARRHPEGFIRGHE